MSAWKHTVCPCGSHMVWSVSVNGKPQPFDAEPSEKGNVELIDDPDNAKPPPVARVVPKLDLELRRKTAADRGEVLKLYIAHHATCPRVLDFKRSGKTGSATQARVFGDVPA